MTYEQENVYVLSGSVNQNQITLQRVSKSEDGTYVEIAEDQIVDAESVSLGRNTIEVVVTAEL